MSTSSSQRVRRIASPSTKQGPMKATLTFGLKQNSPTFSKSSNSRKSSPTSPPTPQRNPELHRKALKSTDQRSSPDRGSPNSPGFKEKFRPIRQSPSAVTTSSITSSSSSSSSSKRGGGVETLAGPYLKGEWPRPSASVPLDSQLLTLSSSPSPPVTRHVTSSSSWTADQATQTPDEWFDEVLERKRRLSHKRSSSTGSGGGAGADKKAVPVIKARLGRSSASPSANISSSSSIPTKTLSHSHAASTGSTWLQPVSASHHLLPSSLSAVTVTVTPPHTAAGGVVVGSLVQTNNPSKAMAIPMVAKPMRVRGSVEGLNQEIETLVLKDISGIHSENKNKDCFRDGHRAPVAELLEGATSRTVDTQTPSGYCDLEELSEFRVRTSSSCSSTSSTASSCPSSTASPLHQPSSPSLTTSPPHSPADNIPIMAGAMLDESRPSSAGDSLDAEEEVVAKRDARVPDSPGTSFLFVREPPDGCEKVKRVEESRPAIVNSSDRQMFCPLKPPSDRFHIPSAVSAFCPLKATLDMTFKTTDMTSPLSPSFAPGYIEEDN